MAMDSSECNGSAEAPKVELEAKAGIEFGSEKDLAKSDGIASTERELNDQDEIGGPFVIINGDSDNSSEKFLQLDEKVDPDTTSEDEVSAISPIKSGNGIGVKEVKGEPELNSGSVPVQGDPLLENSLTVASNCEEKLEEKSKEGAENGELSDNVENNMESRNSAEDEKLSKEPVAEEDGHEKGQECELSLAGEFERKKDVNLGMSQFEHINGEDNGSELGFEPVKKVEEEHPVSSSIEGADEENGRMHESETSDKPNQHVRLDITMTVEEQVPQVVETEASLVPSVQVMYEELGTLSDSLVTETKAEMPLNVSLHSTLDLAVEAVSEKKHEMQEVFIPSEEEVVQTKAQVAADSLQENKEVGMLETESKEQPLLDSAVGVECELKHEEESGPSQEDEQQEESEGVSDSMQSNEKSHIPETELNNQSPMESTVEVESGPKHEEQCEASIFSQEEKMHEKTEEVPVPSDGEKEIMEVPETELKETSSPDFEFGCKEVHRTVSETKVEEQQDTVTTVSNGEENGASEISPSHILLEEKQTPCSSSPDQAKLAETDMNQESNQLEVKSELEADDKEEPSESTYRVEEMQNLQRADATCDGPAVSTSHEIEVDSSLVNGKELVESSSDVSPDSENKSTSEVEESDRSLTEFEDGKSKTEEGPVSLSSNDPSARAIAQEDSLQIGTLKISIGENGPAILQQELQGVETSVAATPEEPGTSTCNGEKPEVQPLKRQPIYIVKVPRYSDEEQWEKIQEAQARLDELTRTRDAIRGIMQQRRKACSESWDGVAKAKEEEKAARTVFSAKRQEINSAQSVINKLNKANSIDDMDDLIEMKEKSLQHETMTLKQEKMLIQEIKELKSQRKKLIENMGSAAEIDEAFDQKDCVFDKLKTLKTELEVLGKTVTKAEAKSRAAQKAYDEIDHTYCTLQDEYKSADDVRQKAYYNWRNLRSQLAVKNNHFFKYRDDQKRAASFLGHNPPDKQGLRLYCNRQVENMMELWNSDADFRKQYIISNKNSTLRRLRTLDGRSLGPDEVPPVIPATSTAYRRTNTPLVPATKEIRLEKSARISSSSSSSSIQSNEFPELLHQKPNASHSSSRNSKGTSSKEKVMNQAVVMDIVAAKIDSAKMEKKQEEDEMERRKREEEAEREKREEDIKRKAKAEAEEKEKHREEQKAKAKEAEERKKRKAEKAQERAVSKARRDAEIREQKKTKKEKKKAAGGESDSGDATNGASAESSTTSEIAQIRDVPLAAPTTASRRPTRPQVVSRQLKRVEPVPVALRNRGRRKMRSWIIGIVTAIAALLTVFFIGNYVNFSDISSLVWL